MYAVIDVGSNSVRLMLHDGEHTISKQVSTTKLAEGIVNSSELAAKAIDRTAKAIITYVAKARTVTNTVMIFATEAVRRATNSSELLNKVYEATGIEVDVVSGEMEAQLGYVGVGQSGKCTVVDIGGASTEIIFGEDGKIDYAKSIRMGGVVLRDACGEDETELNDYITTKLAEYGELPVCANAVSIGGTATTIAALIHQVQPYDPALIHGSVITKKNLQALIAVITPLTLAERREVKGMFAGREDIIVGAMHAMYQIMSLLKQEKITVSESDNLEGYLIMKLDGKM